MHFPDEVKKAFKVFLENGFSAYAVGGCVRDFLLNKVPFDYDIATDASPGQVMEIFNGHKIIPTGLKHGTVTVLLGKIPVEITTFRTEGPYLDNRRPSAVRFTNNIEDDLSRRDFTINAIAYSPFEGYIDIFGGKKDIEKGTIRCVNDPMQRFSEDALRLLRALRLSAELGFDIEQRTKEAIHKKKELLGKISAERICIEFTKLLKSPGAGDVLKLWPDVVGVFLPELLDDPEYLFRAGMLNQKKELSVKLAFLLKGILSELGAEKALCALKRLKYDNRTVNEVKGLLFYQNKKIVPEKKQIKIWMGVAGKDLFLKLLELIEYEKDMQLQKKIAWAILNNHECYTLDGLAINGDDLIRMGIKEGKTVGRILHLLLFEVVLEKIPNNKKRLCEQAEILYKKYRKSGA